MRVVWGKRQMARSADMLLGSKLALGVSIAEPVDRKLWLKRL